MSKLDAAIRAETRVNQILSDSVKDSELLKEQLKEVCSSICSAGEAMRSAAAANDAVAYRDAKAAKQTAEDIKEMKEMRLETLISKPLMESDEYLKTVKAIYDEAETARRAAKKLLSDYSEKMAAVSADIMEAQSHANAVLKKLQDDVYRSADRPRGNDGHIIQIGAKAVDLGDVIFWGNVGVRSAHYSNFKNGKA